MSSFRCSRPQVLAFSLLVLLPVLAASLFILVPCESADASQQEKNGTLVAASPQSALGYDEDKGATLAAKAKAKVKVKSKKKRRVAPLLPSGYYTLHSKMSSELVVGLSKDTFKQYAPVYVAKNSEALYQRLRLHHLGNNVYSLQIANSGKYLTSRNRQVVQKSRTASGKLSKKQKWKAEKNGNSIVFLNVADGKALTVGTASLRSGGKLKLARYQGTRNQRFSAVSVSNFIPDGVYTVASSATKVTLDVAAGSWKKGARVQVWESNATEAQKFRFSYVGGGYYRISMGAAGTMLEARHTSKSKWASVVCMPLREGAKSQLWRPVVGTNGIILKNKRTGTILTASGEASVGSKVKVVPARGEARQAWRLSPTTVNRSSLSVLREAIKSIKRADDGVIVQDDRGTGYIVSSKKYKRLEDVIRSAWDCGAEISFVMLDVDSGVTLAMGADRGNHAASTFKGPYVTYLFQKRFETGDVPYDDLVEPTVGQSSNEAYLSLRGRYGVDGYARWLDAVGIGHLAYEPYPRITARDLALAWARIYAYEQSGGGLVGAWRDTFDHSYYSCIREALGGSRVVYSKPGWYPKSGGYTALNDAAIVKSPSGTYLVSIVSTANCSSEKWILHDLAWALDDIHSEMP